MLTGKQHLQRKLKYTLKELIPKLLKSLETLGINYLN